jgi:outer membrane protein assembly factor BamB
VTSSGIVPVRRLARPPLRVWLWTAGALVLAVVAAFLWRISDARATSSTTAPAPRAATGTPAGDLSRAWSASGRPLPDQVVQSGRVIVGSGHGVTALDPATGREVWHYTRSNVRLCGVTTVDGLVVTAFAPNRRCTEMVALRADTGAYAWTRNVDFRPDVRLTGTEGSVLAVSPTGVVDIDPAGDNIRWRYHSPSGCGLGDAVAGTSGTAVLQVCPGSAVQQVRLLDSLAGTEHWTRDVKVPTGAAVHLAGADGPVTVQVGDDLQVLAAKNGVVRRTITLGAGDDRGRPAETTAGGGLFLLARGTLFSLDPASAAVRWHRPAAGLPDTLPSPAAGQPAVLVPERGAFVAVDPGTGKEQHRLAAPALPAGGRAAVVGSTVVYRLPGTVQAYR